MSRIALEVKNINAVISTCWFNHKNENPPSVNGCDVNPYLLHVNNSDAKG